MLVQCMDVMYYPEDGSHWKKIRLQNPSWEEVEFAIRRLDKYVYPFIWFSIEENLDDCDFPDFEIIGGKGDYLIVGSVDGYFQRSFYNPDGNLDEVWVWESDQGYCVEEQRVCHDLNTVLQAIKYFCEHGTFDPLLAWEDQERNIDGTSCP